MMIVKCIGMEEFKVKIALREAHHRANEGRSEKADADGRWRILELKRRNPLKDNP